jgi:hypothetical protein
MGEPDSMFLSTALFGINYLPRHQDWANAMHGPMDKEGEGEEAI